MNKVLQEVSEILATGLRTYLPNVQANELEENGTIYYMNGRNGTIFDWFVNGHLCPFMCFYDDADNLGAVQAILHKDGTLECFYYKNHSQEPYKEVIRHIYVLEEELTNLAAKFYAGERKNNAYDSAFNYYDIDEELSEEYYNEFINSETDFSNLKGLKSIYNKNCLVSKMIIDDGYRVGFMTRYEPATDSDCGWCFYSGIEDDSFYENINNMVVSDIATMISIEPDIESHITSPIGTGFIRGDSGELEPDVGQDQVNAMKRENK